MKRRHGVALNVLSNGGSGGHAPLNTVVVVPKEAVITSVDFSLFGATEVERMSSCHVVDPVIYDKAMPRENGLNSRALGTVDASIRCTTCGHRVDLCPGHTGHHVFPTPLYHIGYLDTVLKVLRCVCFFCSTLLVSDLDREAFEKRSLVTRRFRFSDAVSSLKFLNGCPHCLKPQPSYSKESTRIACTFSPSLVEKLPDEQDRALARRRFNASDAREILRNIRRNDALLLGFDVSRSAPHNMITATLLIPPPIMRPTIKASTGSSTRGQDDLTHKLQEILTASINFTAAHEAAKAAAANATTSTAALAASVNAREEALRRLQLLYALYINNNVRGEQKSVQRSGAPSQDYHKRLKGKQGRFRGNLVGKRVDFSGRTVVSPGPDQDLDQVGIARHMALAVQRRERVTPFNIEALTRRVRNGPGVIDGASRVICTGDAATGRREKIIDLQNCQRLDAIRLLYGWEVERPLADDDYVIFNRQPSLHKKSMMAHRVMLLPPGILTHTASLGVTSVYNADFDGDEMNIFSPNEVSAHSEMRELLAVPHQLLDAANNRPCFGLVQDSLVSVDRMTCQDVFLTRVQMMDLAMCIMYDHKQVGVGVGVGVGGNGNSNDNGLRRAFTLPEAAILAPCELWTGKQAFSMLLPGHTLNLERFTRGAAFDPAVAPPMSPDDTWVCIRDSELLCGRIGKDMVGRSNGGVTHVVALDYGNVAATRFLSDLQRVTIQYLEYRGFSIGIEDCLPRPEAQEKVREMTQRVLGKIDIIYKKAREIGVADKAIEASVTNVLGTVLDHSARIVNHGITSRHNSILATIESGSKGNKINLSQILGCVGQQSVDGKRIQPTLGGRTLPCYRRKDKRPQTRGFIQNSYLTGLTPEEFFFHAQAGREGLIDTAVKTATTGYIQRKLMKSMEAHCVAYDYSVRSTDHVVDWIYGGDNMDASLLETVRLDWLQWDNARVWREFGIENDAVATIQVKMLLQMRDEIRHIRVDCMTPELECKFYLPFDISRVIDRAVRAAKHTDTDAAAAAVVSSEYAHDFIMGFFDIIGSKDLICLDDALFRDGATLALRAYLLSTLCVKRVVCVHKMSRGTLEAVVNDIWQRINRARVNPGEMVGSLAAESVGEPCTQLTLSSFHYTGVATKNVSLGVPRVKELINCSTNLKTPSLTLRLIPSLASDRRRTEDFARSLERVLLQNVVDKCELELRPAWGNAIIEGKYEGGGGELEMREAIAKMSSRGRVVLSDWCLVLCISARQLALRRLTCEQVADAIGEFGNDRLFAGADTSGDVPKVIIRVTNLHTLIRCDEDVVLSKPQLLRTIERAIMQRLQGVLLSSVHICGLVAIKSASAREMRLSTYSDGNGNGNGNGDESGVRIVKEWVVDTDGTSLESALAMPQVNPYWSFSNDIHEVNELLGIEAASALLFHELMRVLSFDGTYVNDRHVMMIVRTITRNGYLMPITRHGINRLDTGTLMRASFEETVDVLYDAAAFSEIDNLRGVTEAIIVGKRAQMGSGICDILVDHDLVNEHRAAKHQPQVDETRRDNLVLNDEVVLTQTSWQPSYADERFENYGEIIDFNSIVPMEVDTFIPIGTASYASTTTTTTTTTTITEPVSTYRPSEPSQNDIAWLFENTQPAATTTTLPTKEQLDSLFASLGMNAPVVGGGGGGRK